MTRATIDQLSGNDDALFRALLLLMRKLHVQGVIDARHLVGELNTLAGTDGSDGPRPQARRRSTEALAERLEAELSGWSEARSVEALYRAEPDAELD